jgi:hypothetical protein
VTTETVGEKLLAMRDLLGTTTKPVTRSTIFNHNHDGVPLLRR